MAQHGEALVPLQDRIKACQDLIDGGDLKKAKEIAETIEGITPASTQDWQSILRVAEQLQRPTLAEIASRRWIERNPDEFEALIVLAKAHKAQRRMEDAQCYAERASNLDGLTSSDLVKAADLRNQVGDYQGAVETCTRAILLDTGQWQLWRFLVQLHTWAKHQHRAAATLKDMIRHCREDYELLTVTAELAVLTTQRSIYLRAVRKAMTAWSPDNHGASARLALSTIGMRDGETFQSLAALVLPCGAVPIWVLEAFLNAADAHNLVGLGREIAIVISQNRTITEQLRRQMQARLTPGIFTPRPAC